MKRALSTLALVLVFALALGGCSPAQPEPPGEPQEPQEPAAQTATLYAVLGDNFNQAKEYPLEYTGELTPEVLAAGLGELTGLDFFIDYTVNGSDIAVDWVENSTLIGKLDDREQKEEFFFFDVDSLSWFMMDSLYYTLTQNLGYANVYYTMSGGQTLYLEDLSPDFTLAPDAPYEGSSAYMGTDA